MKSRRKPDYEAVEVGVKANSITDPEYFPKSKTDGSNRIVAEGNVEIDIRKQHPRAGTRPFVLIRALSSGLMAIRRRSPSKVGASTKFVVGELEIQPL